MPKPTTSEARDAERLFEQLLTGLVTLEDGNRLELHRGNLDARGGQERPSASLSPTR